MATKLKPLGICDHCGGEIPKSQWYTTKRKPRLYCSRDCLNTANSRAGTPIRLEKVQARIASGEWQNPAALNPATPAEQSRRAGLGRKREVEAGTWRNPALTDEARIKLSRPRKHSGALHSAIEKLGRGVPSAELTDDEREAHREYRRRLRTTRRDVINADYRARYRRRQAEMTDEERKAQRAKWREANHRRAQKQNGMLPGDEPDDQG